MVTWHPTLFQAALAMSVVGSVLLAVLVGKVMQHADAIETSRRWDEALRDLSAPAGELPPGFEIIPEPPFDWSVDA